MSAYENRQVPKKKKKGMSLPVRFLVTLIVIVLVVFLALQIAVWLTEFNSIGELLDYITANISKLPR